MDIKEAWIRELDRRLGWNDLPRSYRLLGSVLHAMRDALPDDATDRFPVRLCGTVCDRGGWPAGEGGREPDFFARVSLGFRPDPIGDPAAATRAVLDVLNGKIAAREAEDLRHMLPAQFQPPQLQPQKLRDTAVRGSS